MEDIHLHIERVILEGIDLPAGQAGAMRAALAAELTRLLTEGGLDSSLAQGGAFAQAPDAAATLTDTTAGMGRQIAQSVYGSIGQ